MYVCMYIYNKNDKCVENVSGVSENFAPDLDNVQCRVYCCVCESTGSRTMPLIFEGVEEISNESGDSKKREKRSIGQNASMFTPSPFAKTVSPLPFTRRVAVCTKYIYSCPRA